MHASIILAAAAAFATVNVALAQNAEPPSAASLDPIPVAAAGAASAGGGINIPGVVNAAGSGQVNFAATGALPQLPALEKPEINLGSPGSDAGAAVHAAATHAAATHAAATHAAATHAAATHAAVKPGVIGATGNVAVSALKIHSKLVAPLFLVGAKVTAPFVKVGSKIAAPFVLAGATLAKPILKPAVKISAPLIKLGQIQQAKVLAAAAPLTKGLKEGLSPIAEAGKPLEGVFDPIHDAAALGLEGFDIQEEIDKVELEQDLDNLGEAAGDLKVASQDALAGAVETTVDTVGSLIGGGSQAAPTRRRRSAHLPYGYDHDEASVEVVGDGAAEVSTLDENDDPISSPASPGSAPFAGSPLFSGANSNSAVASAAASSPASPFADPNSDDAADADVQEAARLGGLDLSDSEAAALTVVPPPQEDDRAMCTAFRSELSTSQCHREETYRTKTCSNVDCSSLRLGQIHRACQMSSRGRHCNQFCFTEEDPVGGTCISCTFTFTYALSDAGDCREYNRCLFGNKVCPNYRPPARASP